jgi:hypothetical protein
LTVALDALAIALGSAIVVATTLSAVATLVVPRGVAARLTRMVFLGVRRGFDLRMKLARTYEQGESAMAWYAPVSLLLLAGIWLGLIGVGFTAIFYGLGAGSVVVSFEAAASCLTTLGFVAVDGFAQIAAGAVCAALGLLLIALLISYLPTIYSSFQRREALVTRAAMQAGSPPTGVELLVRFQRLSGLDALAANTWQPWTEGFVDIEESHTSIAALPFFRSPRPERHWLTAAGAVLDAASLRASTVDLPRDLEAELTIRAGYLALRHIADFFAIPYDADPQRGDWISITRDEWEEARRQLAADGVPLRDDIEEAWLDFAGWRVNYDAVLLALSTLTMAPYAPWSSDRGPARRHHPPILGRGRSTGGAETGGERGTIEP